ncbi:MAG: MerR family transcriptional regulator [Anaerolineae bacterium]|nr:MerR family transcriptional regulator [Anaerolineae bacterium]
MRTAIDKTPRYNLNVVVRETGVKADTLRSWERRYQLPRPERSPGGHRLFSDYDIATVKWLTARQEEGMSIGRAAALWEEIEAGGSDPLASRAKGLIQEPVVVPSDGTNERLTSMRGEWLQACLAFNEEAAEQVLGEAFALFPLERVCLELLQAGLVEVGERWYRGMASVQQEHFTSELAIRRLHALMAAAPSPVHQQSIILCCPPGELHTFPPLFLALMLRYRGWPVVYLGANVPAARLEEMIDDVQPTLVVQTAARLNTAAALLDSGQVITSKGAMLGFGGRIFTEISDLDARIPGHFLGEAIQGAVEKIEGLLSEAGSNKAIAASLPDHSALIKKIISSQPYIEGKVLQEVRRKYGAVIPDENLIAANDFFHEDILAALKLGEVSLAESNLLWLAGMLGRHPYQREALMVYLKAYADEMEQSLGEDGQLVIAWLNDLLDEKRLEHGDEI